MLRASEDEIVEEDGYPSLLASLRNVRCSVRPVRRAEAPFYDAVRSHLRSTMRGTDPASAATRQRVLRSHDTPVSALIYASSAVVRAESAAICLLTTPPLS